MEMSIIQTHIIVFVILFLKSAGFSAAADATRLSVLVGLFKVTLNRSCYLTFESGFIMLPSFLC